MPAGSGDLATVSFTPSIEGVVALLVTFKFQGLRDDGGVLTARLFVEQSGVRTYAPDEPMTMVAGMEFQRFSFALQHRFAVAAGAPVLCGLWGQATGGPASGSWRDMDVSAWLHKRAT